MSQNAVKSANVSTEEVRLRPEGEVFTSSLTSNFDCMVVVVHCAAHDTLLVSSQPSSGVLWLPFTQLAPNRSWKFSALFGLCVVLAGPDKAQFDTLKRNPPFQSMKTMQVVRLQLPVSLAFRKRITTYFRLKEDATNFKCCQSIAPHLVWMPLAKVREAEFDSVVSHMWGPELVQFGSLIADRIAPRVDEYSVLDNAYHFVPRDPARSAEESMLKSVRLTLTIIERLYASFLDHCFPSLYMTERSFAHYMAKHDFERDTDRVRRLFNTFDTEHAGFVHFGQLLLGLACMEPNSLHSEYRVGFILRYYDTNNSGKLSLDELRAMVQDMKSVPPDAVDARLNEVIVATGVTMAQMEAGYELLARDITAAIGSHKFRGTSSLCRSAKPIFSQIAHQAANKNLLHYKSGGKKALTNVLLKLPFNIDPCEGCLQKKYELAAHRVQFGMNDRSETTTTQLEGVFGSSSSQFFGETAPTTSQPKQSQPTPTSLPTAAEYSMECVFKPASAANVVLQMIREFNHAKGTVQQPKGLLEQIKQRDDLWMLLKTLYIEVDILLNQEFKCQATVSPCYIIGDIHGNLNDLLSLERTLWPHAPVMSSNFLFLGDYVDRGKWGFECALYLIALKVLCPNQMTLLRGNHEVRALQRHYSYYDECLSKYGGSKGLRVWELTNKVFDKLPVCGTVDEAIFCAHGGIGRSLERTDDVAAQVPRELRDPEKESRVAWEILWSDPCSLAQFLDICQARRVEPDSLGGFVYNVKRGTAWLFTDTGATGFLRNNFLTHIVRAHEVAMPGYVFHFGSKCVTIFSSSHYCGNENDCGFILADRHRLRVVTLDTVNNDSATD